MWQQRWCRAWLQDAGRGGGGHRERGKTLFWGLGRHSSAAPAGTGLPRGRQGLAGPCVGTTDVPVSQSSSSWDPGVPRGFLRSQGWGALGLPSTWSTRSPRAGTMAARLRWALQPGLPPAAAPVPRRCLAPMTPFIGCSCKIRWGNPPPKTLTLPSVCPPPPRRHLPLPPAPGSLHPELPRGAAGVPGAGRHPGLARPAAPGLAGGHGLVQRRLAGGRLGAVPHLPPAGGVRPQGHAGGGTQLRLPAQGERALRRLLLHLQPQR